jgi:dTDP-4-dehydrorhamnose 3,5-epimerase
MSFKVRESFIPGCFEIIFTPFNDARGSFIKTFHSDIFKELNVEVHVAEEFFTYSKKNVFRGLHFQVPPMDLSKIIYCVSGSVKDFVVDLRVGSPTYGKWTCFELNEEKPLAIYIPPGLAHGFYVNSSQSIMQYKVSKAYDPDCDKGISYTTFDFAKDIIDPVISEKDSRLITMDQFESPFIF